MKYHTQELHVHLFFILDTELTNLNLKSNERRCPYLNFDYLELEYHELSY